MDEQEITRRYYRLFLDGVLPPVNCPNPDCESVLMARPSKTPIMWECWGCNRKFNPGSAFYDHLEDLVRREEQSAGQD